MALPKVEKDMQIIAKLADEPNSASGDNLDSLALKQKFDEGGEALKAYINDILLPYLEGVQAAASIGIAAISGISGATTVQAALEALKLAIDNTSTGSIPDASLSGAKLLAATITNREIAANAIGKDNLQQKAVTAEKIADNGIEELNLADRSVAHRHLGTLIVEDDNIADNTISGGKIKDNTLTARLFAAGSVSETALQANAVTAEKIANGAVSQPYTATFPASGWTKYTNTCGQSIAISGLKTTDTLIVDLDMSNISNGKDMVEVNEAWGAILKAKCSTNGYLFLEFDLDGQPNIDLPVKVVAIRK